LRPAATLGDKDGVGPLVVALAVAALGPAPRVVTDDAARVKPDLPIQGPRRGTSPPPTSMPPSDTPPSDATSPDTAPPVERPPIELEWSAPPACPKATDVERELVALLGDRDPGAPWVRVVAKVTAVPDGFALELVTETSSGKTTHTLASPDCAALAHAVALVAAVAADPMAVDRKLERDAARDTDAVETPPPKPPKAPVAPPVEKRPRLRLARFALRADALLDYNVVPKIGFGPVITLGIFGPHWRTEVGAIYVDPRTLWIDDLRTAGADIGMWGLRVRGCGVPTVATVEFPLCGALEGGQVSGRPLGPAAPPQTETHAWGAFSLGGSVTWSPRPFIALVIGLDLVAPFRRPRFLVPDGRELHQVGRVGLRANFGIELRVP
jgi:hypothetical protein